MRFLCKIGLHRWRWLSFTNLLLTTSLYECRSCHARKLEDWYWSSKVHKCPISGWPPPAQETKP